MKNSKLMGVLAALAFSATFGSANAALTGAGGIFITEWMYNGLGTSSIGEFVEFTNLGLTAIDMTGWSFDDDSRAPGSQSLSAFGIVQSGESVILTDQVAATFRTNWNLSATVKVIGGNSNNLGRLDEINLYDNTNTLMDRLTYNDVLNGGTGNLAGPRTNGTSGRANGIAAIGANNASLWTLSTVGDVEGSYRSVLNEIGSPGKTSISPVPLPGAMLLMLSGLGVFPALSRRKKSVIAAA